MCLHIYMLTWIHLPLCDEGFVSKCIHCSLMVLGMTHIGIKMIHANQCELICCILKRVKITYGGSPHVVLLSKLMLKHESPCHILNVGSHWHESINISLRRILCKYGQLTPSWIPFVVSSYKGCTPIWIPLASY